MVAAPEWTRTPHVWTEAEIAAAKPYPIQDLKGQEELLVPLSGGSETQSLATAVQTFAGGLPEGEVGNLSDLSGLEAFLNPSAPSGYGYPDPFTRYTYYGKYYKEYPYKTIGKLYFVQYGVAYVCSAASIGGYAIWTAGHCVHAGNGASDGWSYYTMFLPGYDAGKKKLGAWYGSKLWTTNGWYYNGAFHDHRYDMGGIVLLKSKRKAISAKVGWLGFAYTPGGDGSAAPYHWFEIGYPQAAPFDGQKQVVCASSYAYSDGNMAAPHPIGVGCDQTGGTSGGPWIMGFGLVYWLNGNMSYRYTTPDHPNEIFSPFFGDAAYNLWHALVQDVP